MKTKIILIIFTIVTLTLTAQENYRKCNTTSLVNKELRNNLDYLKARKNARKITNTKSEKTTITIPVVIHIIHRTSHSNIGSGTNISNEQIEDALKILNEDYSKTNPEFPSPPRTDFINYWGNPDLEFCLATTDPNGNTTSGITRTATAQINWDADDDDNNDPCHESNGMKKSSCGGNDGWDPYKYLNIWVCDLTNSQGGGMTLGYAYLPGLLANPFNTSDDYKDGLVVDYRYFGTVGIAAPSSDGRTPTHEIGHYLGLSHTFAEGGIWQGFPYGCADSQGNLICCDNDDDNVDDTPACLDIYFGGVNNTTNNNSCNDLQYANVFNTDVLDMDENYMSYASTTWMFSNDQVNVMQATLNTTETNGGRLSLKNSNVSTNCSGIISSSTNINSKNIGMYPNPNTGRLFFNSSNNIKTIIITNIIGETVFANENISSNHININSLNNGIYFVTIYTENQTVTKKIVLSK